MGYAICVVSAAAVRQDASHRSEMINQLLFGETMEVLEVKEEWRRIRSVIDHYEGWITHHMIKEIEDQLATATCHFVTTGLLNPLTLPKQLLNLPMGSSLTGFNEESRLLWDEEHKYHGTYRNVQQPFNTDLFWSTVHSWLNAPYLWGGRTFMGVDCSGFTQVVFKILGIGLQRDAKDQAGQGTRIQELKKSQLGDLAFFQNREGKIIHVGILLNEHRIIHASGKVRIDKLTEGGILNMETGEETHQLHSIKRYF
jgi:hypothetical protein